MPWTISTSVRSLRRGRLPTPRGGYGQSWNCIHGACSRASERSIVLEDMSALTAPHRRVIKARKRAYSDFIRQTIEQLHAAGKFRDVNPTTATFSLIGMISWILA